jgi:hypothetical protein
MPPPLITYYLLFHANANMPIQFDLSKYFSIVLSHANSK